MTPTFDADGYLDLAGYDDVDPDVAVSSAVLARLHAAFDAPLPEMPTDAEWSTLVADALVEVDEGPFASEDAPADPDHEDHVGGAAGDDVGADAATASAPFDLGDAAPPAAAPESRTGVEADADDPLEELASVTDPDASPLGDPWGLDPLDGRFDAPEPPFDASEPPSDVDLGRSDDPDDLDL